MRSKRTLSAIALAVSGLAVLAIAWQASGQGAGKGDTKATLPIRQVVLFNSGVSYLQREGEVDGNSHIDLSFPTGDINDLLKSMILQDLGGGKISTVNYDSHDPIDKVLHSFAIDLNDNPTLSQILNQARGEKIEVQRQGQPARVIGIIVGMEVQKRLVNKDTLSDVQLLNLTGESGLQSIPLDQIVAVRFLNPVLEAEFQRALRVVASSHDTQKKAVSLNFTGQGKRPVRVGYVVEHPIWKTSYRLKIDPDGKLFIQGWAIVENTSDDDWNDVHMTLVAGRPISFKMDLYQPLYIPRPTVEPELFASLRPPVYSSGVLDWSKGGKDKKENMAKDDRDEESRKDGRGPAESKAKGEKLQKLRKMQKQVEELQDLAEKGAEKLIKAQKALDLGEGVASLASASELGEYYQYVIDQKITLARQKSAMLPILNQHIDGAKVSIYNESVQAKYPLLGLRLKNSSKQPLNQGPITVYEDGSYAGDTRILDLQANEERLLSFALDQAVEIKSESKITPSPDMNFKIGAAELTAHYQLRETRTYTIKNRAAKERHVLIEHPIRGDWKLIDPKKPTEAARDVYRFEIAVPAGKTVTFDVVEEQARTDQIAWPGNQPQYVAQTGIQIKAITHVSEPKLLAIKIDKGLLTPTLKTRESKTYFVQNNSDLPRTFTIDHIIRPDWVRLDEQGDTQRGPGIYRFVLKAAAGKVASREVIEERTYLDKARFVRDLPEDKLREYLSSNVVGADVKTGLTKYLAMSGRIAETRKNLDKEEKDLKQLSDDQARLRENLKIIPQSSEQFKKFLDKFVAQESAIENYQKEIRQLQATLQQQERELTTFLAILTAD